MTNVVFEMYSILTTVLEASHAFASVINPEGGISTENNNEHTDCNKIT